MKTKFIAAITSLFLLVLSVGCSKDDGPQVCRDTSITMLVNGELQSFQALGRGINSEGNGYRLQLYFQRIQNDPYLEQSGSITLRFKKTGENIIENITWHQYINSVNFDAELTQPEIQSNVEVNTNWCFYGTFAGTFDDGHQQITVSDAKVSYIYETPFE